MYGQRKRYRFELKAGSIYTGEVFEEDSISVRINTIRNENIILHKENILKAIEIEKETDNNQFR